MLLIPDLAVGIEPVKSEELLGGGWWLYRFDNGYGASVVCHAGSYGHEQGLYELLLARFTDYPEIHAWGKPTYTMLKSMLESEPTMDDHGLMGWLTLDDVARVLGTIRGWSNPYLTH